MDCAGLFHGGILYACSSSLLGSSTDATYIASSSSIRSLSYHHSSLTLKNLNLSSCCHLAAFHSLSDLFSYNNCPSPPHLAKTHKSRIFLPRSVASKVKVEETYIIVKPDGVEHGLVGEIISRFEKKGFKLTGVKLIQLPKEFAEDHYKDLNSKSFFPKMINYITSGPIVCMAWVGVGVVASAREIIGSAEPPEAGADTIRGDLVVQTGRNVVHESGRPENKKQ